MKVRMKTTLAGPEYTAMPGSIQEFSDETALCLVRGGYADIIETTMIEPPELAVMPKPKARRVKK